MPITHDPAARSPAVCGAHCRMPLRCQQGLRHLLCHRAAQVRHMQELDFCCERGRSGEIAFLVCCPSTDQPSCAAAVAATATVTAAPLLLNWDGRTYSICPAQQTGAPCDHERNRLSVLCLHLPPATATCHRQCSPRRPLAAVQAACPSSHLPDRQLQGLPHLPGSSQPAQVRHVRQSKLRRHLSRLCEWPAISGPDWRCHCQQCSGCAEREVVCAECMLPCAVCKPLATP